MDHVVLFLQPLSVLWAVVFDGVRSPVHRDYLLACCAPPARSPVPGSHRLAAPGPVRRPSYQLPTGGPSRGPVTSYQLRRDGLAGAGYQLPAVKVSAVPARSRWVE